jgi:putative thioredoxin
MDMLIGQKAGGQRPGSQKRAGQNTMAPTTATPGAAAADNMIVDGTQQTFMQDVIEASRSVPVLVDFWATWCGPCKQLTPALEKVTRAAGGRVKLVKIDIDANRALVQQLAQIGLPLQSVPTVAAFWQGQIADLFQGALPESEIKRFVESLLKLAGGAMPAADLLAEARAAMEAERFEEAGSLFSALLQEEPENPAAWAGLVRVLMALGQEDQAREALEQIPPAIADHAEVSGARSALALAEQGRQASGQLLEFERRLAADPADHQARYELAAALNASGRRAEAADALLHIIKHDRSWNEDAARLQLLKLFEAWGLTDPATLAARRKLSALLFS